MENNNKKQFEENELNLTEEQKEDIVDIIGDSLREALNEDDDAHFAEVFEAAVDICTVISAARVFYDINFEAWRISHQEAYAEVKRVADLRGVKVSQQLFDNMISKIAKFLGRKYPPFDVV